MGNGVNVVPCGQAPTGRNPAARALWKRSGKRRRDVFWGVEPPVTPVGITGGVRRKTFGFPACGYLSPMAKLLLPFWFALFAALGNVFFVLANRKTANAPNPMLFTLAAMLVSTLLFALAWLAFGTRGTGEYLRRNIGWTSLAGLGMFMTFYGFYLLYSRFDTSYYALFVVTSMLLTTLGLGWLILREPLNGYGIVSIAAAVASIVFFWLSKR